MPNEPCITPEQLQHLYALLQETFELTSRYGEIARAAIALAEDQKRLPGRVPGIEDLAYNLGRLTENAEAYRDTLSEFIDQAEDFMQALEDIDACWNDR